MGVAAETDQPVQVGRWQGVWYCAGAGLRALVALTGVVVLGLPFIAAIRGPASSGAAAAWVVAGLALIGLGLPFIAAVLARADWGGAADLVGRSAAGRPEFRLRQPRTLVRPLAYAALMLTLGGAVAVFFALLCVAAVVALISPVLTATGTEVVIGPITLRSVADAWIAAAVAVVVFIAVVLVARGLARLHAGVALQMLTRPEQRLQHDLAVTTQSRARLVRAFDVERRRIERDLHDGVQPQLLSVSMTLGLALAAMPPDAPGRADVARAQDQARDVLSSLRRFVRNIHPQVLIDHGLGAALAELADTFTLPVDIVDELPGRLPADLETNLYFCGAELLANAVKHSAAQRVTVTLQRTQRDLVQVRVHDDGHGGAGVAVRDNGGLSGIADRVAALDGDVVIDSPFGGPTTVTITVPDYPVSR